MSVSAVAIGQKLTGSCKYSKVALNSSFQVTYTLSGGSYSKFTKPSFSGFTVTGQFMSSGGGMTIIMNGKMVQSGDNETTWTYTLVPTAVGKYTIEAAQALVDGTWIKSNTISIEVTNSTTTASSGTTGSTGSTGSTSTTTNAATASGDLFIKAYADKLNPYQGEQVIVTYKIYTKVNVTQYAIDKLPAYTGFWSNNLTKENEKPKQYYETIGSTKYAVAEIRKFALFPQKTGVLKVDPLEVECTMQVINKQKYNDPFSSFFNDPFFSNFGNSYFDTYSTVEKKIYSNALTLNVKALPANGQPEDFSGSVGKFAMETSIDKKEVKTNEAINLTVTFTGIGNLNLIDKPSIEFPADLETYDPDIKDNTVTSATGVSGSKTFSYLIIPRNAGDFTIPSFDYSYFDLTKGSYVTLSSPEYKIKVAKGIGDNSSTVNSSSKEDIKYLNSDIRYIKTNNTSLSENGSYFYGSTLFFSLLASPLALFAAFVFVYRKKLKEAGDLALLRNKKATGVARKRLKTAHSFLIAGSKEPFLDEVFKALWGYSSDKLSIPLSELTKDNVQEKFSLKSVNSETTEAFIKVLNNCEFARFAPSGSEAETMDSIYNEAVDVISNMEKVLK